MKGVQLNEQFTLAISPEFIGRILKGPKTMQNEITTELGRKTGHWGLIFAHYKHWNLDLRYMKEGLMGQVRIFF